MINVNRFITSWLLFTDQCGVNVEIRVACQPGSLPSSFSLAIAYRNILHGVVFRLWGHKHQSHQSFSKGTIDCNGRIPVHGLRADVPYVVGWNICIVFHPSIKLCPIKLSHLNSCLFCVCYKQMKLAQLEIAGASVRLSLRNAW